MKTCSKCKESRPEIEFNKSKSNKDGLAPWCKLCVKQYDRWVYQKNSDKIKQQKKEYRQENPEKIKQYKQKNVEKIRKQKNAYQNNRRESDPLFKFSHNIRALILKSFKRFKVRNFHKQSNTVTLLGCTIPELRDHLEKQFQPGMTLANHGEWHIDHIIPLASAKTQQDMERLCHYTNLQPLWASDNMRKGAKLWI